MRFDSSTGDQCIPGVNGSMTVSKTAGGGSNPSGYAKISKRGRVRFIATVLKTVGLEIGP